MLLLDVHVTKSNDNYFSQILQVFRSKTFILLEIFLLIPFFSY